MKYVYHWHNIFKLSSVSILSLSNPLLGPTLSQSLQYLFFHSVDPIFLYRQINTGILFQFFRFIPSFSFGKNFIITFKKI